LHEHVEVEIMSIDKERKRIGLRRKWFLEGMPKLTVKYRLLTVK
jgi:hypothetical protein